MLWWIWLIIILVALAIIVAIFYYNRFVVLGNRIDNSASQIDVQLRKRADLVPSLVKVVKAYAKHERELFEKVTKARSEVLKGNNLQQRAKAGNKLQEALKSIFAVAENYPDLKADQNFLQLQQELAAIEDKVAYARQYYNDSVLSLDNASEKFPGVMFFKMFGRQKKDYLKIPEEARAMPEIDL
ncbi:LemA family protein [Candidatus Pacearchaeota archaeon]|nr:LemA family protein [Candidatus Pacearchaeota archaeon]MBD3283313.1 LemA family protein [Candidatus Pacearchaeota archaeon]